MLKGLEVEICRLLVYQNLDLLMEYHFGVALFLKCFKNGAVSELIYLLFRTHFQ